MTVEAFVEELRGHWSWLYELYISKLYDRQWAQWELLTIAGVLSLLLLLKIIRRRRRAAAKILYAQRLSGDPSVVSVKLAGSKRTRRNGEDRQEADDSDLAQLQMHRHRWTTAMEESGWAAQPVRDLRREIIKRDQTEARLQREVTELSAANKKLEREVAGLMVINERLVRRVTEDKPVGEPSTS
ncbi:MAG: hypothetical protein AMJ65_18545 [Phycisphaerae bacterium SG8_4]|nr:MAG: hypothetical protein AMJ65_18545 [Phycisphaerae bacterium SG8_4]